MSPNLPWSPVTGALLPRCERAFDIHTKLAGYSLDLAHKDGGPKARGFELMLGITIDDIGYLADALETGVLETVVSEVRDNAPYGFNCVVDLPIRGLRTKSDRIVEVRTVWQILDPEASPRLVTAYIEK